MSSTIVALATPPGVGAIHVIRISGPKTFEIVNKIALDEVSNTKDRLQITFIKSRNGQLIDQVVIAKYYSPNSYTGEDCIEISCHGNMLISKLIIDEILKFGAVYASKGEFTKRAFLNNKIDLNQALSIGNLFNANSESEIYSSVQTIKGNIQKELKDYPKVLLNLISECELNIDYPREIEKEDDIFLNSIRTKVNNIYLIFFEVLCRFKKNRLSNYRIAFVGKSNSGKSSLINFLIQQDKIIVSDRKGTTQDPVEVDFCFDGYIVTLVDTAGIDSLEDLNNLEAAKKSHLETLKADLLVYLIASDDLESSFWEEKTLGSSCIKIFSKSDLLIRGINSISVKNKDVEFLLASLRNHLSENYSFIGAKSQEGVNYLSLACDELKKILDNNMTIDLMAEHLNNAYRYLCFIFELNLTISEKIDYMFDSFCVGK